MKTYIVKKEKWYHSNFSIYSDNKLIGHFIPEKWKSENWVTIDDEKFLIKRKSIWRDEKLIYSGNNLIGTIMNRPFNRYFIISIFGKTDYIVKLHFFKNTCTIETENVFAGEYRSNWKGSILYAEINMENSVIAAILVQINSIKRTAHHAAM
jgi:hypothetical protein